MATFDAFLAQTRRELEEATASVWADESLLTWTNEAVLDLSKRTGYQEQADTATTVEGQADYPLPDNTVEVKAVTFARRTFPLTKISTKEYSVLAAVNTTTGTPSRYTVFDDAFYLHPAPDVAATLTCYRTMTPTAIASTSATSAMPFGSKHDMALRNFVKARAYEQIGDERSQMCDQLYQREAAEAVHETALARSADSDPAPREVY